MYSYPTWQDEDPTNFARVRDQRLPTAQNASRNLQSAVGIAPGTKMIGEAPVLLWRMPEPPTQTTTQMFENLKAKIGMPRSKQCKGADNKNELAKMDATTINNTQPLQPHKTSLPSKTHGSNSGLIVHPATPPPSWISNPRTIAIKHPPAYWSHTLSQIISRWLEHPGTKSTQISLLRLDLRGLDLARQSETVHFVTISPENSAKAKLSRLSLSASVIQRGEKGVETPPLLDWIVLQVNCKNTNEGHRDWESSSSNDDNDKPHLPFDITPHWLLAFPLQAITATRMEYESIPASSSPWPQSGTQKNSNFQANQITVHVTKLCLGTMGRVPLVHGRGTRPNFLQRFMEACAEGRGIVELRSLESLGPMLNMS